MAGKNLPHKILERHRLDAADRPLREGELAAVQVDWILASELAWGGMDKTYSALDRPPLFDKDRFYLALDHTVDARTLVSSPATRHLVKLSRGFAKEAELTHFYDANETIMHTEFYRQLVRPGELVLGADSHTCSHGGIGALAIGLGGADVVAAMVLGYTWLQVPETVRVDYTGRLRFGVTGKDVILNTLRKLGRNTVTLERAVEYTAERPADFTADFRFTICNMTAELGGVSGIFVPDCALEPALAGRTDPARRQGLALRPDDDAVYCARFSIDLDSLLPQVARPFSPDNVCDVNEVAGQRFDGCFIGACTTTQDELILAGRVLEAGFDVGWEISPSGNRVLVPGSQEVSSNLEECGLLDVYRRAGFRIEEPGCSMCLGIASDRAQPCEIWLSSQNRNFPNRMGKGSEAWLASAVTVAASSFNMQLTDPRPLLARIDPGAGDARRAPIEVSLSGPTPAGGNGALEPARVRIPLLKARALDGPITGQVQLFGDHVDTDAIIAGEFCHLSTLEELGEKAFFHFRPNFREQVRRGRTVIVAGIGWGCGSSREHAAWALRGAGVTAVVAKSLGYIHKRNLVNEGLPYVVLHDEAFFERIREGDEVTVDSELGLVTLRGQTFQGDPVPDHFKHIVRAGGIVPFVRDCIAQQRES